MNLKKHFVDVHIFYGARVTLPNASKSASGRMPPSQGVLDQS